MSKRNQRRQGHFSKLFQSNRLHAPFRRRLRFEPLEDRRLLATLTVNSLSDIKLAGDGIVTLREAVLAANNDSATDLGQNGSGEDTIVFAPGVTGTILLTSGQIQISDSINIVGPGRDVLTIDAQNQSRIFYFPREGEINFDKDFRISGLTLANGNAGSADGGAIRTDTGDFHQDSVFLIEDCKITGSIARRGGGISSPYGTIRRCIIEGNTATGTDARGGGVSIGNGTITDSILRGNSSTKSGGAVSSLYLTITNTVIDDNSAATLGGGIYNGAELVQYGNLEINNCTITNNEAARGGGAYTHGFLTANNSVVQENHATAFGGGLYAKRKLTVNESEVTGNTATKGGGLYIHSGFSTIDSSLVSGNVARVGGGALAAYRTTMEIRSSTISGNRSEGRGGALFKETKEYSSEMRIRNSTVTGNSSIGDGGAIYSFNAVKVYDSCLSYNSAQTGSGGPSRGGAIYSPSFITITNSTLSGNVADRGGAVHGYVNASHATIANNHARMEGGGIYASFVKSAYSIIAANTAGISAPDIHASVTANYSLIGDNAGTDLPEAQLPDAAGNWVGSASGAGVIDPRLAPLNNNGGSTKTHALLPGSPALDMVPVELPPSPAHDYRLNSSLTDSQGGPALQSLGGTLQATGYKFNKNQGLTLSSALANPAQYTIEILFKWDALSGGYQKILDFKNRISDLGLYSLGNALNFVNGAFTANIFQPTELIDLFITRDDASDMFRVFVGGNQIMSFHDVAGDAVFSATNGIIQFFRDDTVSSGTEAQAGFVDRIRVFNNVLDASQIEAVLNPPVLPAYDQRGTPYARLVDYDGIGGPRLDLGAYESQGVPSYARGDYNTDGIVDLADYTIWRNTLGTMDVVPYSGADGNGDGDITPEDYGVWKSHFGDGLTITPAVAGAGSAASLSTKATDAAIAEVPTVAPPPSRHSGGSIDRIPTEAFDAVSTDPLLLVVARSAAQKRGQISPAPWDDSSLRPSDEDIFSELFSDLLLDHLSGDNDR